MNLYVGLGRVTPLLMICAVGFSSMFLMCPLAPVGEGGAGVALLQGALLARSKGVSGNSMLGYKYMMWKAE